MFLNLLLWDLPHLWRRWGRLVCYVIGCGAIWCGFGGWAWGIGEEWALAAWLVLGLLNMMAGLGVGAMWLWHGQHTDLAEQDPALAPHGVIHK
jgi:hypothetical protein